MTVRRAFLVTFSFAALVEVLHWFSLWPSQFATITFLLGHLMLLLLGFLIASAGRGYGLALSLTWPFAVLWLGVGMLNFLLGRGGVPPDWTPENETQAFYGYLYAWLLFLPLAFASTAFGVLLGRVFKRVRRRVA